METETLEDIVTKGNEFQYQDGKKEIKINETGERKDEGRKI